MKLKKLICIGLTMSLLASVVGGSGMVFASDAAEEAESVESAVEETVEAPDEEDSAAADEAAADEISPDDISVTWEDSRIFPKLSLGKYVTVPTFGVTGYEDVPFLRVDDYLDVLFEGKEQITIEDGTMIVSVNGTQTVIDPAGDTLYFEDPSAFRSSATSIGGILDAEEANVVTPSTKHESVITEAMPLTVSLKEYNMPIIPYEDTLIMPLLALQNTFAVLKMDNALAYNGKDYYNAYEAKMFLLDEKTNPAAKDSPYMNAIVSGPFSEKTETTQAYADYGYYSICLLLDLTFGHKEEKNITTFDDYFTKLNAKNTMTSTDPQAAVLAEILLFNYLFDSGHDSIADLNSVFGSLDISGVSDVETLVEDIKTSEEGDDLFNEKQADDSSEAETTDMILGVLTEKGFKIPEVAPLFAWGMFFSSIKPKDYGTERLDYAGDTAVIYFNGFNEDSKRDPSYYLDPINEDDPEKDTFSFFYNCFEDIKTHEEVKNVVINLSDNGGGAAGALIAALGFLSEDGEVLITNQDLPAGNYKEEWYHVDTNLDGVADDEDGYGGQYDFYIMCSGSSYSCANAMPYFAQKEGLAKIIGTNPGGGDCVVGSFVDAYGRCAAYSGMLKLGTEEENGFVSDEKATTVDFNMLPEIWDITAVPWYDAEGIADAVHQYQNGATEITFSEDPEETLSTYLQGLFEQIGVMANSFMTDQAAAEGTEEAVETADDGTEEIAEGTENAAEVTEEAAETTDEGADTVEVTEEGAEEATEVMDEAA